MELCSHDKALSLLDRLTPEEARTLAHTLGCRACQFSTASRLAQKEDLMSPSIGAELFDRLHDRCRTATGPTVETPRDLTLGLQSILGSRCPEDPRTPALVTWCRIGEVRAIRGDLPGAEQALSAAASLLNRSQVVDRAFYCGQLGELRRRQMRFDEAAALLVRSALLFSESGEALLEAGALLDLGGLYLGQNDPGSAFDPLAWAARLSDMNNQALWSFTVLTLAVAYIVAEAPETARSLLSKIEAVPPSGRSAENVRLLATWVEALLSPPGRAVEILEHLYEESLDTGDAIDAAVAIAFLGGVNPVDDRGTRLTQLGVIFSSDPLLPPLLRQLVQLENQVDPADCLPNLGSILALVRDLFLLRTLGPPSTSDVFREGPLPS